jgi:hypothetical protein
MTASSVASIADHILKRWYHGQRVAVLTQKKHKFLDVINKNTNFVGEVEPLPFTYQPPHGFGNTVAEAQANASTTAGGKFLIDTGDTFASISLGDKAIEVARNNVGAFIEHKKKEIDAMYKQFGQVASRQLLGNGGGALAQVSSVDAGPPITVTLTSPDDIVNFEAGMVLKISTGDGTGGSDALTADVVTVTKVLYGAGTFECTVASASGALQGDAYLFLRGIFSGNVTQVKNLKGLQAWFPASDPGASDSFFGFNRSVSDRLSGYRLPTADAVGTPTERLERLAERINTRFEAEPDLCLVHPSKFTDISRELQANNNVSMTSVKSSTGSWGHDALKFQATYGSVRIMAEKHCPRTSAFLLSPETLVLKSIGQLIRPFNGDGLEMLRAASDASYELRLKMYAQLTCEETSANGRTPI